MRLIASPTEGDTGSGSPAARIKNGFKNGARGLRSVATFLPARLRGFFADLGPGLITGAADDDPSGISTYSVAGATFGYAPLWTALFSFPLMVSVQLMCARLGMVTGRGLAGVVRRRYSRGVLWAAVSLQRDHRHEGRRQVHRGERQAVSRCGRFWPRHARRYGRQRHLQR